MSNNKKSKIVITVLQEDQGLLLGNRFTPDFDQPLPHLSQPGAQAVAVIDAHDNAEEFFCLLCEPGMFVRVDVLTQLIERSPRRMRLPHAAATIRRTNGQHYYAVVFDNARARPLSAVYPSGVVPERDLITHILPGIVQCLNDISSRSICHRSIRPDKILIAANGEALLDQCILGLPGEHQPALYEPLPSMMTMKGGRGEGLPPDDYYALGVTALELATGQSVSDDNAEVSLEEQHATKIQIGSYNQLLRRRKFSSALQALFAGTLGDSGKQRWDIEDLRAWAGGHWDMPRPTTGSRRGARAIPFAGRDIYCPELLAWVFHANPEEAAKVILSQRAERWLRNVLEDNQAADAMEDARKIYQLTEAAGAADVPELVTRACFALDPNGPLRFRSLVVSPSGVSGALWTAFREENEEVLEDFRVFFQSQLLQQWLNTNGRRVRTALPAFYVTLFRAIILESGKLGFGLERILYELLPSTPCLQKSIEPYIAHTAGDVVVALERVAASDQKLALDIGLHIGGFVLAKDKTLETTVRALNLPYTSKIEAGVAVGDFLAFLQRNYFELPLHHLCRAMADMLIPELGELKSRLRRMVVKEKIEHLSKAGDLTEFIRDLDMKQTIWQDAKEFEDAKLRLQAVDRLITIAGTSGQAQSLLAQKRGYRYARLFSMSVSFLTIFYFSMVELL